MSKMLRLREFVSGAMRLIERHADDEAAILAGLQPSLAALVRQDDWLDEEFSKPDPESYRQYLLYGDPLERLSVISIVWGAGQKTPIHDHRTWCLVAALRGAELSTTYDRRADGTLIEGETVRLEPGMVAAASPRLGDIHTLANAYDDRISVSIHVYGGNLGGFERAIYDPATGATKPVFSRYANARSPNLWAT